MSLVQAVLLFIAALAGGALNSVAGGGSFLVFPTLIFAGVPPINASATTTVAMWPGSIASIGAYHKEINTQDRRLTLVLTGASLLGGILGAIVLLNTPQITFEHLIPFLLLLATALFAFSGSLTRTLRGLLARRTDSQQTGITWRGLSGLAVVQLVIATYGGFFGGGIGILMLATLSVMGMENIHAMNGLKTLLASFINGIAVVAFVIAHAVYWPEAIVMVVGAIIGGYGGGYFARQLDPQLVRRFVIVVGCALTVYFFIRPLLHR